MMKKLAERVTGMTRWRKRAVVMGFDGVSMAVSLWLSFCIRLGHAYWPADYRILLLSAAAIGAGLVALVFLGIYKVIIRYLEIRAASRLALGAGAAAIVWFVLAFLSHIQGLPRSVGFIYFGLLYLFMFFGRAAASRFLAEAPVRSRRASGDYAPGDIVSIAIHGANATGCALADSLRRHPQYKILYFVDASSSLTGRTMMGIPIHSPEDLRRDVQAGEVDQVLLAMPAATRTERLTAISGLSGLSVSVKTVPSYEEIMSGRFTVSDVRPVNVEDLLKRDVVPPRNDLIDRGIEGHNVLITGAGGSIGSEICRQVLRYSPKRIVLLDHSEFALYTIETELKKVRAVNRHLMMPEVVPIVGSLLNERLLRHVLSRYAVDTVFHAAAYKHVPLLEHNEVVGVENNVVGTKVLADACVAAGVSRLTMISTDKAVRPTNVMGSSKRMAELYIQALAKQPGMRTCFGIVRFGNVLDSSGSVVQQFRKQIQSGGPVTVTHPDITRFFMSIPEATQLVLQANSMATGGEVFVLDMGEPVRIADLARTMISLSGMSERNAANPTGDIEISYVGLRPGEKLHEELFVGDDIEETAHPQIKMARERSVPLDEMQAQIERLTQAIRAYDPAQVRSILRRLLELDHQLAA